MTINIYDAEGGAEKIELMNNGENTPNIMQVKITDQRNKEMWFNLSKEDAREVIRYFRKEFKFSLSDF